MITSKDKLRALTNALLGDDYGIPEQAWVLLREVLAENELLDEFYIVDSVDGRFFIDS
jgi:hypothetical protein